ncbi:MAG: patatin-like phospholipase family protein, partial [Carnobacterium sp.]
MHKKIGLVLSGGGARGAYQIGVWKALIMMGIKPDIVTATSVGTVNAAMIIQDDWSAAYDLWQDIETSKVFDVDIDETKPLAQKVSAAIGKFMV